LMYKNVFPSQRTLLFCVTEMARIVLFRKSVFVCFYNDKDKGKAIPLQVWTSPEGSRRLRLPDFKTIGT